MIVRDFFVDVYRILSRARVTVWLLLFTTGFFLVECIVGGSDDIDVLVTMGAVSPDILQTHEYWRAVACLFLHAGVLHWLLNMWMLVQIGALYEVMFGPRRFALTYFVTGIVASFASALTTPAWAVGASGALFGILGAFVTSIKRSPLWRNDPMARSLVPQLVFWGGLNIAIGLEGGQRILGMELPPIDNAAHIGGLVAGLILGLLPHRVPPPPPSDTIVDVTPHHYGSE